MVTRRRAVIIFIVLWILALFTFYAATLSRIVLGRIDLCRREENAVICPDAAESLVAYVTAALDNYPERFNCVYGLSRLRYLKLGNVYCRYTLSAEDGKININIAKDGDIDGIFGASSSIADVIKKYRPRPFSTTEEFLLVAGNAEERGRIDKLFTVYGSGKVNINMASGEVLRALGINSRSVESLLAFRAGEDGIEGTRDDGVFKSGEEAVSYIRSSIAGTTDSGYLSALFSQGKLSVNSRVLRLKAEMKVLDKPAMEYDIIFNNGVVLQWRER